MDDFIDAIHRKERTQKAHKRTLLLDVLEIKKVIKYNVRKF
jgi:hypothetical protein